MSKFINEIQSLQKLYNLLIWKFLDHIWRTGKSYEHLQWRAKESVCPLLQNSEFTEIFLFDVAKLGRTSTHPNHQCSLKLFLMWEDSSKPLGLEFSLFYSNAASYCLHRLISISELREVRISPVLTSGFSLVCVPIFLNLSLARNYEIYSGIEVYAVLSADKIYLFPRVLQMWIDKTVQKSKVCLYLCKIVPKMLFVIFYCFIHVTISKVEGSWKLSEIKCD